VKYVPGRTALLISMAIGAIQAIVAMVQHHWIDAINATAWVFLIGMVLVLNERLTVAMGRVITAAEQLKLLTADNEALRRKLHEKGKPS
jgi:hypothetical protein